jgi:hypothetical protein
LGDFLKTIQGKIVGWLIVIAILIGISAEVLLAYKTKEEADNAAAIAYNASKLQLAQAEEKVQLAKKAAADAETARAAADNAAKLKIAEAEKETQLAKKAAAEAETARATAENSARMQAALAAKTENEARKIGADATVSEFKACAVDDTKCTPEQRCIVAGLDDPGSRYNELSAAAVAKLVPDSPLSRVGGYNQKCAHLRSEANAQANAATAAPSQVPPKCRQNYADWQGYTFHAAFAVTNTGGCVWSPANANYASTAQAVAVLKNYCNQRSWGCTIIATK